MRNSRNRAVRRVMLASVAAVALSVGFAYAQTSQISTPEQPLAQTLKDIAHQTGENILFTPEAVAGIQAHAVNGNMSARDAVIHALAGTNLEAVPDGNGGLIIRRAHSKNSQAALRDGAAPSTSAEFSSGALETIVVTAEKHTADMQKTAVSIAVVTGDNALRQGQTQLDDVMAKVGAVRLLEGEDGPTFYIRGIGTGVPSNVSDPEVNLNIDGIYQSEPEYALGGLYDLNRVEVLRGPQGTLYGRNAVAGVVNLVTNDPSFDYEGGISVGVGNYNLLQAQGFVNVPLSDTLALRVAFGTERHKGYLTNGADDADVQSGRVKLLWQPNDRLKLVIAADDTHEGGEGEGEIQVSPNGGPPGAILPTPAYPGGTAVLGDVFTSSNPWTSPDPNTAMRKTDFWSIHGQLDWDLGFGVLTAIPAYRDYTYQCLNCWRSESDQAQTAAERQTTAEVRLASEADSRVTWLAGLYYLDANTPTSGIQVGIPGASSLYIGPGNPINEQGQTKYLSKSYAAFGQVTYPVTDWLRLTGGLRYTEDQKSEDGYVRTNTDNVISNCAGTAPSCSFSTPTYTWHAITYNAGFEADVGQSSMVYAKISTGYKAGGMYQGAAPNSYNPEHLTSYEIGSKNRFLDDRLQINLDAFYYNYRDYQVFYLGFINPVPAGIFGILTLNAPGATVYGADIEARYLFTPDDEIDASVYPLHAKFGTLVVPSPVGGPPFGGTYSGFPLPFAPSWSANLGYQHSWKMDSNGLLTARIETHLEAATWVTFDEKPGTHQPSYSMSNAYLTYDFPNGKWSLTAYVKNIENTPVLVNGQSGPMGVVAADIAPPRTFGLQLTAKF